MVRVDSPYRERLRQAGLKSPVTVGITVDSLLVESWGISRVDAPVFAAAQTGHSYSYRLKDTDGTSSMTVSLR
jgi:hypothetical protein